MMESKIVERCPCSILIHNLGRFIIVRYGAQPVSYFCPAQGNVIVEADHNTPTQVYRPLHCYYIIRIGSYISYAVIPIYSSLKLWLYLFDMSIYYIS